jgi:preprotein translocase subunit SecD
MLCLCIASAPAAVALDLSVVSARADRDHRSGRPIVSLALNDQSKRDFASFTTDNIGRKSELRVGGKVVSTPVIREPITGGAT